MTRLYRPLLIETAEQAEALPEGTVVTHPDYFPQEKFGQLWGRYGNTSRQLAEEEGWSALVPIEAEEEWGVEVCEDGDPSNSHVIRAVSRENAEWRLSSIGPLEPGWARIVTRTTATPWKES